MTAKKPQRPDTFKGTDRAWRRHKRAQWRELMRAADQFLEASAYTPTRFYPDIYERIKEMGELMSAKKWGK